MKLVQNKISIVAVRGTFERISLHFGIFLTALSLFALASAYVLNSPPQNFPIETDFIVHEGSSVREIGYSLKESGYIRSTLFFRLLVRGASEKTIIQAGSYRFTEPYSTQEVIKALKSGTSRSPLLALTFPEGFSIYDIREYTKDIFQSIYIESYLQYEGFLFPDTYYVTGTETLDELISRMRTEYEEKIAPYREQIAASGKSEREIIILASILEREANDEESMGMVSGILNNRLEVSVPLQVDAVFEYILGKTSEELTLSDLALDSPYNTYTNKGLPPTPIANPGLMAIEAALNPTPSAYFYYLTGADGTFHYAKDFEGHKINKERYLRYK